MVLSLDFFGSIFPTWLACSTQCRTPRQTRVIPYLVEKIATFLLRRPYPLHMKILTWQDFLLHRQHCHEHFTSTVCEFCVRIFTNLVAPSSFFLFCSGYQDGKLRGRKTIVDYQLFINLLRKFLICHEIFNLTLNFQSAMIFSICSGIFNLP